ncbi:UNVERIFIED_ORG: DNA-binding transcriptional LysR family regulator [Paraburkholderia sediminicola]|nr:DNA-binding transcriptional LysR family regulator [Paraburkholderia sediminicola]
MEPLQSMSLLVRVVESASFTGAALHLNANTA